MSPAKLTRKQVLDRFESINVWKRRGERAPNKPLLLLWTLARISRGESSETTYQGIEGPLTELLKDFGPRRRSYHPEYPFWYLRNDGIWQVSDSAQLTRRKGKDTPTKTSFRKENPTGKLTPPLEAALASNRSLLSEVVGMILDSSFPASIHDDILNAVGMRLEEVISRRKARDPRFRSLVLRAYEYQCAVCGFDVRLGSKSICLEAAHIRWHQAEGPDIEPNGLALCAIHHKLLDHGAFSLTPDRRILVSQEASGYQGLDANLLRYKGRSIRPPQSPDYQADPQFINWHFKEVFHGPARS